MPSRIATVVWPISPELVLTLDERLGPPVDSYVNGSQTWLTDLDDETTLEWRLHPVAGYRTPGGLSHYDVWESVVGALSDEADQYALRLGDETRPLTGLWDGLECFVAHGDDLEPATLATTAVEALGLVPERAGMVDHEPIAQAWEQAGGQVSIIALLLEHMRR